MDGFAAYGHTLVTLALWGLMMIVLSALSTRGRDPARRCDCGKPKRDYSDPVYRRERAFQNAIETTPAFLSVTLAAMLAGASPATVNWLASLFLIARIAMAYVHIQTENQPWRSALFSVGWLCIILLALVAIYAVFFG